jgi:hypothetical protein
MAMKPTKAELAMATHEARTLGAFMLTLGLGAKLVEKGVLTEGDSQDIFDGTLMSLEEAGLFDQPSSAAHCLVEQLRDAWKMEKKPTVQMALRVLACGGREYTDAAEVARKLDRLYATAGIAVLIEGGAIGADRLAQAWANERGVPVLTFEADWLNDRRAAGPIRNQRMLVEGKPDLVVVFPGKRGTANMVRQAREAGVMVWQTSETELPRLIRPRTNGPQ